MDGTPQAYLSMGIPGKNTGVDCHILLQLRHWLWLNDIRFVCGVRSVQSFSHVQLFATSWTVAHQASLSISNSQSLLKLMSIESVMSSNHLILSSLFLPTFNLFQHQSLLQWVSSSHQVTKILQLQLQHQSFQWLFRTDFLQDGLIGCPCSPRDSQESSAPQLKFMLWKLLEVDASQASTLWCSAFFIVQLSHPYMTTGKTIALTRWTFVGKVMSLLFIMLSRLVITLLPKSKHLLISWLQSPSAVILEPPKIKSVSVSIVSLSSCHEMMRPDAMIFVFWMLSFKPIFSLSFTFIKRLFSSSSLSAISVVSPAHMSLLIFLPQISIPACALSSPVFLMMYSAYKLNKQGDNI